ncbi:hypothetical protein [Vibrio sp. WXL103]|uniref:hypothetical protein n=1 Tax=unclassified Vibrio TaxID=2614977 RepID=UPI003EC51562
MKANNINVLDVLDCYLLLNDSHKNKILSLYINTDFKDAGNHKAQPDWKVELIEEIGQLRNEYGDEIIQHVDQSLTWDKVEERIIEQIMQLRPRGRALAVFTDFIDDVFIELSRPVETEAFFGTPEVETLMISPCIRKVSHYPFL